MNCLACFKEIKGIGYCLNCRKRLFDGFRMPAELDFAAPDDDNLTDYQEHSKRMSISGVQLKYSLRLEDKKLVLTDRNGQYILKPVPPSKQLVAAQDVPANEHLTMQIAEQVFDIRTASNCLIHFRNGGFAYLTRRFDVKEDGSKYLQEDFAQLLNRSEETHGNTYKYDGTYEEIGLLIKQFVAANAPALERFFKLIVFNYVISNGDAHLKNFSLLRTDQDEYELTPAYDLISTIIHSPGESDTALDLYADSMDSENYRTIGCYGKPDFLEFARRLGMIEKRAVRIIDTFHEKEKQIKSLIEKSFLTPESKLKYARNLQERLRRIG